MEYKVIIKAYVNCTEDELIGAKEAIRGALELMGADVERIDVIEGGEEK